jgi:hypothetical protein
MAQRFAAHLVVQCLVGPWPTDALQHHGHGVMGSRICRVLRLVGVRRLVLSRYILAASPAGLVRSPPKLTSCKRLVVLECFEATGRAGP